MSMTEAIAQIAKDHKEELLQLPLNKRLARMTHYLTKYRAEHPEDSTAWSQQYV